MSNVNYANRGKSLEELINYANQQYLAKRVALVRHIPTDWTVIKRGMQIISAFPVQKSAVDYIGVTRFNRETMPLAFDAMQCVQKTSFPLSNIERHQLDYLVEWKFQGGTSFFILEMLALSRLMKLCRIGWRLKLEEERVYRLWTSISSKSWDRPAGLS